MDSVLKFISKINAIKESPSLTNLNGIVSDIWQWSSNYPDSNGEISEAANRIEDMIAICFDKEAELTQDEIEFAKEKLTSVVKMLDQYIHETIYVLLLDEGTDVWRPVVARKVDGNKRYIIEGPPYNEFPVESETWEFEPGSDVIVEHKEFNESSGKVAVSYWVD